MKHDNFEVVSQDFLDQLQVLYQHLLVFFLILPREDLLFQKYDEQDRAVALVKQYPLFYLWFPILAAMKELGFIDW